MCTVTFLPLGKADFILTSNRDEQATRKTIHPKKYVEDGIELVYPKDELAGGTWIGLGAKKRLICLLNGGFEVHEREASYKMSRGIIVKAILKSEDALQTIGSFDFHGIEPFTIVLVDWNTELQLHELVWDGKQQHLTALPQEPKIWSSSTLYTKETKQLRQDWFSEWLQEHKEFTEEEILKFHVDTKKGTPETSLQMKRWYIETVSVTSVKKNAKKVSINYKDLVHQKTTVLEMP